MAELTARRVLEKEAAAMLAARETLSTLPGLPAWAVVLIVVVSTTTFNAAKVAALVDALSRAVVRAAVARRLTRPGSHPARRAATELRSADLTRMVRDALVDTTVPSHQTEVTTTATVDPETGSPPPSPPDRPAAPPETGKPQ